MRLGQLARHLDLPTSTIVQFLAEKEIVIKDHPNVKVDEAAEALVFAQFEKSDSVPTAIELPEETPTLIPAGEEAKEETPQKPEEEQVNITPQESAEPTSGTSIDPQPQEEGAEDDEVFQLNTELDEDGVEVIKAPKVELPGLRVIGKIELPGPKVPEPDEEDEEESERADKEEEIPKVRMVHHSKRNSRPRMTPEQLEQKRIRNKKAKEKRIKEAEERKKEQEVQRLKALKEAHYKKKLAKAPSKKGKKKVAAKPVTKRAPERPKPKTLLGKFWRWLNT